MAVRSRLRDIVVECARPSAQAAFWAVMADREGYEFCAFLPAA